MGRTRGLDVARVFACVATLLLATILIAPTLASASAADLRVGQLSFRSDGGQLSDVPSATATSVAFDAKTGIATVDNPSGGFPAADIRVTAAPDATGASGATVTNLDLSGYSGRLTLDGITLEGNGTHPAVQLTNEGIPGCTLVVENGSRIHGGGSYAIRGANKAAPTGEWGSTIVLDGVAQGDLSSISTSSTINGKTELGQSQDAGELFGAVINPGNRGALTIESVGSNEIVSDGNNNGYNNWPIISPYNDVETITLNFRGAGSLTLIGANCNGTIHLGPQYPQGEGVAIVNVYGPGDLTATHLPDSGSGGAGIIIDGHDRASALNVYGGRLFALGRAGGNPTDGVYVNEYGSANFYGGTTVAVGKNASGDTWGANGIHADRITIQKGSPDKSVEPAAASEGPTVIAVGGSTNGSPRPAFGKTEGSIYGSGRGPVGVNPTIATGSGETFYPWLAQSYTDGADAATGLTTGAIPTDPDSLETNGNVLEGFAGAIAQGAASGEEYAALGTQRWVKISPQPLEDLTVSAEPSSVEPGGAFALALDHSFKGIDGPFTELKASVPGEFALSPVGAATADGVGGFKVLDTATSGTITGTFSVGSPLAPLYPALTVKSAIVHVEEPSKTSVRALVDECMRTYGIENDGRYTEGSWRAYRSALDDAVKVLDDPLATPDDIARVDAALEAAVGGLTLARPESGSGDGGAGGSSGSGSSGGSGGPGTGTGKPVPPTVESIASATTSSATQGAIADATRDYAEVAAAVSTVDPSTGVATVRWSVEVIDGKATISQMATAVIGTMLGKVSVAGAVTATATSLQDSAITLNLIGATAAQIDRFGIDCLVAAVPTASLQTDGETPTVADIGELIGRTASFQVVTAGKGGKDMATVTYAIHFTGETAGEPLAVYRLYNPHGFQHLYTTDTNEVSELRAAGWDVDFEGKPAWYAPKGGSEAAAWKVLRLYNPSNGDHCFVKESDAYQISVLTGLGWQMDGETSAIWSAADDSANVEVTTLFNPNADVDTHLWTIQKSEVDARMAQGWKVHAPTMWGLRATS